jgi:hypothetical protein
VSSWFPDIHTDAYGDVYLTWESVRDPSDPLVSDANGGALMLSQLRDGQWTEPADIYVKDIYNAARPILASDEDYLHLLSRSPRNEGRITIQTLSALYYMRAPLAADVGDARSWSAPVRLTSGPAYWAQLLVLDDGTLLAVYNQIVEGAGGNAATSRTVLFSRRSLDQGVTWGQPVRISDSENRVARSSLVESPVNGTLIVAWDEGYDNLTGNCSTARSAKTCCCFA